MSLNSPHEGLPPRERQNSPEALAEARKIAYAQRTRLASSRNLMNNPNGVNIRRENTRKAFAEYEKQSFESMQNALPKLETSRQTLENALARSSLPPSMQEDIRNRVQRLQKYERETEKQFHPAVLMDELIRMESDFGLGNSKNGSARAGIERMGLGSAEVFSALEALVSDYRTIVLGHEELPSSIANRSFNPRAPMAKNDKEQLHYLRLGLGVLASAGFFFAGGITYFGNKEGERDWTLAGMYGLATAGAFWGPSFLRGKRQQFFDAIGPLGMPGSPFEDLQNRYNVRGNVWATLIESLQKKNQAVSAYRTKVRQGKATVEDQENLAKDLAPKDPIMRAHILKMINKRNTDNQTDFNVFVHLVNPEGQDAKNFVTEFVRRGGGPQVLAYNP